MPPHFLTTLLVLIFGLTTFSYSYKTYASPPTTTGRHIIRLCSSVSIKKFDQILKRYIAACPSSKPSHVVHRYCSSIKGYAGVFNEKTLRLLKRDPRVKHITRDYIGRIDGQQNRPLNWGLSRISQPVYKENAPFVYNDEAGQDITVYLLDTGVDTTHPEFKGRILPGMNFVADEGNEDLEGHGTHVAGIIAGTVYGVAKKARIVPVKVCDYQGNCATSDLLAGLNWVTKASAKKSLVNISLGVSYSQDVDDVVNSLVQSGLPVFTSAGNESSDGCFKSPHSASGAFTVAASDQEDHFAEISDWGKCVRLVAPGVEIMSAGFHAGTDIRTGTSMSSAFVAGTAALVWSAMPSSHNVNTLYEQLIDRSLKNVLKGVPHNTANRLLHNRLDP